MGQVSIVRANTNIRPGLEDAIQRIGGLGAFLAPGDTVLLKPNLNGTEGFTSRDLTEACVRLLRDFGVRKLRIGEASFGDPAMTDLFFRKTGYADMARALGVDLINLNRSEPVTIRVEDPLAADEVRIAREALEADCILNLPVMKVHYATGITLALKNMKGVLVGDEKKRFHEIGLEKAIADLHSVLPPRLNIVDGIVGMERMGPRGGDPVPLGLILAGGSAAEVDVVGGGIMGFEPHEVAHLQWSLTRQGIDPSAVEAVGERVQDVRRPFRRVEPEKVYPPGFRVHTHGACSACENALLISCQQLEGAPDQPVDVFMGDGELAEGRAGAITIAFGACCRAGKGADAVLRGCPPYPFALRDTLRSRTAR